MLKIYLCGPTVYSTPHIGNLRPITTFDLVLKAHKFLGREYSLIHNITDIDDKIIDKAIQTNTTEKDVSEKYTKEYFDLLKSLNIDTITHIEKVTDNIDLIIDYIDNIVKSGSAYIDDSGNVWFDIQKNIENYGVVSKQNIDKMIFEDDFSSKKFKADFALWKKTTKGIKFPSKFGDGRPGWHTECCALIAKHFGSYGVDIHGGGMDLVFPHHENENIQHYSLFKSNLSKEWLRSGQINLEGIKMSKSLGNVVLPSEFFAAYGVEVYKLMLLTAKFTAPINITQELLSNLQTIETKYKKAIFKIYSKLGTDLKIQRSPKVNEIFEALANYDFAKYNLLLNEELKLFNKTESIENALNIHTIINIIHPTLTDVTKYQEILEIYEKWRVFVDKKDFENADKLREKLMESGLY
ncbi:class I tRNA ligase family protein [Mycoplasma sp. CSL7475-4]|uniref:class I tRNA ligase family protein n=1 Tax=Mycoplasma sp. CSL7475-4 TaxID=2973942 RepID=UPI00216B3AA0|nr:class I tRNA ligase family protein [Mycoplasma sp. CSL7475-4]MCS4536559.1 class I tRNA ligase family protein [Mycoplasma sp. CSL7475-4]